MALDWLNKYLFCFSGKSESEKSERREEGGGRGDGRMERVENKEHKSCLILSDMEMLYKSFYSIGA